MSGALAEGAALQKAGKDPTENLQPERGPAQLLRRCPIHTL